MTGSNQAQIEYWNGRAGEKWSALQESMDDLLTPYTAELKARVGPVQGRRLLDIGCGTGETCAIWLAGGAEVTGVDVSAPMLAVAARRTRGRATLVQADASAWRADAPFDLAVSRFGVMFFDNPAAAFANIAANIRPGGRLLFACWRASEENPWYAVPLRAVQDLIPEPPPPDPHAPGPFAFADKDRVDGILNHAGFQNILINPVDLPICLASEGGAPAAARFAMQIGPVGGALAEAAKEVRALAVERLELVLAPHDRDGRVTLPGAVWMVEAARP